MHKTQRVKKCLVSCGLQLLFICWKNIKWLSQISSAEIREHPLWKSTGEGAQNSVSEGFNESQDSFVKVQLQSDDIWPLIVINIFGRFVTFLVFPIHVTKTPKTTHWIHFVKIFAVHCFPHNSQRPVFVVSHLYVPAVQTRAEAL